MNVVDIQKACRGEGGGWEMDEVDSKGDHVNIHIFLFIMYTYT